MIINILIIIKLLFLVKVLNGCAKIFLSKKYLELLENYKIKLTEMYIKAGYIYDEFLE